MVGGGVQVLEESDCNAGPRLCWGPLPAKGSLETCGRGGSRDAGDAEREIRLILSPDPGNAK